MHFHNKPNLALALLHNLTPDQNNHACKESYVESPRTFGKFVRKFARFEPTLEAGLSFLGQISPSGSWADYYSDRDQ
jgi:hypothetical protein